MAIFKIKKDKLEKVKEKGIIMEKDIQRLTELNLSEVFKLEYVSSQFYLKNLRIDTLCFDLENKAFIIIEYKKDRSFSVIDQGFAYLSAMLNHKADFVLELNEKLNKNFAKKDIDWEQSRIIFISPEFTNYQHNAINFKDLPIYLYEVRLYDNGLIEFDPIKPYKTTESIGKLSNDKIIQSVSKEVKVYTVEDLIKPNWTATKTLLEEFEKQIYKLDVETKVKYTKFYIAYMSKHGRNYVEVVPQQQGLKVFYRFPFNYIKSDLQLEDCSKIGHWTNGNSRTSITDTAQIPEAVKLSRDSFYFLHRDIYKTK